MKILYITTVSGTMSFFTKFIHLLISNGHTVDIACSKNNRKLPKCYYEWGCKIYPLSCSRTLSDRGNFRAVEEIQNITKKAYYDIIHCHTPIAAACTRLACREARRRGTKVIYTAHGFHFYKGAPLKNWIIYYPIEKMCAYWTDVLITINSEDYDRAKRRLKAERIEYVQGVGIDCDKFNNATNDITAIRRKIGVPDNACLLLSVGELNRNKNHETVIRALAEIGNRSIYYIIAGEGSLHEHLQELVIELGISEQVKLLGYRTDVIDLYKAADIFVHPSLREGLPVALMEAMASGLPSIVSEIRGNIDLIENGIGGHLFHPTDVFGLASYINALSNDIEKRYTMSYANSNKIKEFDINTVNSQMISIYKEVMKTRI